MGRRRVCISHQLLTQMITEGYRVAQLKCIKGLPEGAKLVGSIAQGTYVDLIYEHSSWGAGEVLTLDRNIPLIEVVHQSTHKLDREIAYQDRGAPRRIALVNGVVSTDWPSGGTVSGGYVMPLEHEVVELT